MSYLPFMIMMFITSCSGKQIEINYTTEVYVDGEALRCPCGELPEHICINGDHVEARCNCCLHGEFYYALNNSQMEELEHHYMNESANEAKDS